MNFELIKASLRLSTIARSGWMMRGVPPIIAETVAVHSYLVSILALIISIELKRRGRDIDLAKVLAMSLIHDVAEAYIGDIPSRGIDVIRDIKKSIELTVAKNVLQYDELTRLFEEFVAQETIESKTVKLCDSLATYIVGTRYKIQGFKVEDILKHVESETLERARDLGIEDLIEDIVSYFIRV